MQWHYWNFICTLGHNSLYSEKYLFFPLYIFLLIGIPNVPKKFWLRPEAKSLVSKFLYLHLFAYAEIKFFRQIEARVIFQERNGVINILKVYI